MNHDDAVIALARRAGLSPEWRDQWGRTHAVEADTLRRILRALGLGCDSPAEATEAYDRVTAQETAPTPFVTASVGEAFTLRAAAGPARLRREDGAAFDVTLEEAGPGLARMRAILEPGYHLLETAEAEIVVAVAPRAGISIGDAAGGSRLWGLAAQVYGLTRAGDGGIGDFGGVATLANAAGRAGADALALSPLHAGFTADPHHFGPYSPSSRLFLNPLHADPEFVFGEERSAAAAEAAGVATSRALHERAALIDWPEAAAAKLATFRALYDGFRAFDLTEPSGRLALDFAAFRAEGGALLEDHARFEALHGARFGADALQWNWRDWPTPLRDPNSPEVSAFAAEHADEVTFHIFLQWLVARSFAAAQGSAKDAGMAIGLVSDLAVGMDPGGSHAWARQQDVLVGLSVGCPPDLFNADGQSWGLATFSPMALKARGFAPYLATLRASMRYAGGVRIDHAMGLTRLWLSPEGETAAHGAYLAYPADDMMRLLALESYRNDAVVVGEDLGTVPEGFRERLAAAGVAGMRILRFERDAGRFYPPNYYPADALAMTSTHDLPTTAGWWRGVDIDLRGEAFGAPVGEEAERERLERADDRERLWAAFVEAGVADGPSPAPDDADPAVDAAVRFLAATPSKLVLLPLEDALGQLDQPNLPGTTTEHPNWRRRLIEPAPDALAKPSPAARLGALNRRRSP